MYIILQQKVMSPCFSSDLQQTIHVMTLLHPALWYCFVYCSFYQHIFITVFINIFLRLSMSVVFMPLYNRTMATVYNWPVSQSSLWPKYSWIYWSVLFCKVHVHVKLSCSRNIYLFKYISYCRITKKNKIFNCAVCLSGLDIYNSFEREFLSLCFTSVILLLQVFQGCSLILVCSNITEYYLPLVNI